MEHDIALHGIKKRCLCSTPAACMACTYGMWGHKVCTKIILLNYLKVVKKLESLASVYKGHTLIFPFLLIKGTPIPAKLCWDLFWTEAFGGASKKPKLLSSYFLTKLDHILYFQQLHILAFSRGLLEQETSLFLKVSVLGNKVIALSWTEIKSDVSWVLPQFKNCLYIPNRMCYIYL